MTTDPQLRLLQNILMCYAHRIELSIKLGILGLPESDFFRSRVPVEKVCPFLVHPLHMHIHGCLWMSNTNKSLQ